MEFIIIMGLALVAMWFMSSRSRKQQQQVADFRNNLEPGEEVMTTSGLFGTVVEVDGEVVWLELVDGFVTKWYKPAISKRASDVLPLDEDGEGEEPDDEDAYDDEDRDGDDAELDLDVPDDASSLTEPEDGSDPDR